VVGKTSSTLLLVKKGDINLKKDIIYTDVDELSADIMEKYAEYDSVSIVCFYEIATELIKDLLKYEDVMPNLIHLHGFESEGYEDEYLITIDEDGLWCEPLKQGDHYICYVEKAVFVHQECNSAVMSKNMCSEADYICFEYEWEVEYDDEVEDRNEFGCNGDCASCEEYELEDDDDLETTISGKNVTVSKDSNGAIKGFGITWSDTDQFGNSYYSSYSHYSDDEDGVKSLMDSFGIR